MPAQLSDSPSTNWEDIKQYLANCPSLSILPAVALFFHVLYYLGSPILSCPEHQDCCCIKLVVAVSYAHLGSCTSGGSSDEGDFHPLPPLFLFSQQPCGVGEPEREWLAQGHRGSFLAKQRFEPCSFRSISDSQITTLGISKLFDQRATSNTWQCRGPENSFNTKFK